MTFVLAYSEFGVADVTRRYIKDWETCAERRSENEVNRLEMLMNNYNTEKLKNCNQDQLNLIQQRNNNEKIQLESLKVCLNILIKIIGGKRK